MKLLLDENLSEKLKERLKERLKGHVVSTVEDEGWRSIKNGELLRLMIASGYQALITGDQNLSFQQNLKKYGIPVIVLIAKKLDEKTILGFAPAINKLLKRRMESRPYELTLD